MVKNSDNFSPIFFSIKKQLPTEIQQHIALMSNELN